MCLVLSVRLCSLCSRDCSLLVKMSSLRSRLLARSAKRLSNCFNSCRSDLNSASTSSRYFLASSFASKSASFLSELDSCFASFKIKSASRSACPRKFVASCSAFKRVSSAASFEAFILRAVPTYPMTKPMTAAKTPVITKFMFLPQIYLIS